MKTLDFDFDLPKELIASKPCKERSASRLLCLSSAGNIDHKIFSELPDMLTDKDLLIFNDSKVMQARIYGNKDTGGKAEILVERILDDGKALAHLKTTNSKIGTIIIVGEKVKLEVIDREDSFYILKIIGNESWIDIMAKYGHMPLPPYMERDDEDIDVDRYQTIYANEAGSAAAPTAGLHFDEKLFDNLESKGIQKAFVTLHVGSGTFQPVRVDDVKKHKMHSEYIEVTQSLCDKVKETKNNGGRVIAVGTTSVRCLETASKDGQIRPYSGETDIFIYPGYKFKTVDAMITNFHLPKSTLLMLVSSFSGKENIINAYNQAVKEKYRFFSYGDAMFLNADN